MKIDRSINNLYIHNIMESITEIFTHSYQGRDKTTYILNFSLIKLQKAEIHAPTFLMTNEEAELQQQHHDVIFYRF